MNRSFEIHGGVEVKEGKIYYPDLLQICMSRRDALDLIVDLTQGLKSDNNENVIIARCGEFINYQEDENE